LFGYLERAVKNGQLNLESRKDANGGFKWIIVGVDAHFLETMMIKANQKKLYFLYAS